jgi:hypothetical protein
MRRLMVVLVAVLAIPLASASGLADTVPSKLYVYTVDQRPGVSTEVDLILELSPVDRTPGTIVFTAPAGYSATISQVAGERIGDAIVQLVPTSGGGSKTTLRGTTEVADPAAFAADPISQSCAPGPHTAVWALTFGASGSLPLAVDALPTGGSYRFTLCANALQRPGLSPSYLEIDLDEVLENPTPPATYWWRALITPIDASGQPTPSQAYELQGGAPIPETLLIQASWNKKTHRLDVKGTVFAGTGRRASVQIQLHAGSEPDASFMSEVGVATTDALGAYHWTAKRAKKPGYMYANFGFYWGAGCPLLSPVYRCESSTLDGTASHIVKVSG